MIDVSIPRKAHSYKNLNLPNTSSFLVHNFVFEKKKKASMKRAHENLVSANGNKEELVKLWVFALNLLFSIFENISMNFDKNLEKKKEKKKALN